MNAAAGGMAGRGGLQRRGRSRWAPAGSPYKAMWGGGETCVVMVWCVIATTATQEHQQRLPAAAPTSLHPRPPWPSPLAVSAGYCNARRHWQRSEVWGLRQGRNPCILVRRGEARVYNLEVIKFRAIGLLREGQGRGPAQAWRRLLRISWYSWWGKQLPTFSRQFSRVKTSGLLQSALLGLSGSQGLYAVSLNGAAP